MSIQWLGKILVPWLISLKDALVPGKGPYSQDMARVWGWCGCYGVWMWARVGKGASANSRLHREWQRWRGMCMCVLTFMCKGKAWEGKLRPFISGTTASYWCVQTFLQELLPLGRQLVRTPWHAPALHATPLHPVLSLTLMEERMARSVAPTGFFLFSSD